MTTIEFIKAALETSRHMTFGLLDDMKDNALQAPTSQGGNHPAWILGHLTLAESNIIEHVIQGNDKTRYANRFSIEVGQGR